MSTDHRTDERRDDRPAREDEQPDAPDQNVYQISDKPSAHAPSDFSGTDPATAGHGDHRLGQDDLAG